MEVLGLNIEWLGHDCFVIKAQKNIYFDPFQIKPKVLADLILISHEHFDHCSVDDLKKIIKADTIIVAAEQCRSKLRDLEKKVARIIYLIPGQRVSVNEMEVETVPAYNVNKFRSPENPFHPRESQGIGFVITVNGKRIYHAGDTDAIPEMQNLKNIDIAFLPVSGTYVMTAEEAAQAAELIKPKVVIPMHYGAIVGNEKDAMKFSYLVKNVEVKILG